MNAITKELNKAFLCAKNGQNNEYKQRMKKVCEEYVLRGIACERIFKKLN